MRTFTIDKVLKNRSMMLSPPLFVPKMYCSFVGHHFKIVKKITHHIKEYKCSCCGKEITNNAYGKLVPLTSVLKYIHLGLQNVILKRRNKRLIAGSGKKVV